MTVERVNNVPKQRNTKPQKEEYKLLRETLMEPENAGHICIIDHGMFAGDAHKLAIAIRGTKINGVGGLFSASVRSSDLPEGIQSVAVYGGYQLSKADKAKLKNRK